jgi:EmrB/QacA subfamily drug resistance transporter
MSVETDRDRDAPEGGPGLRYGTPAARWVLTATALGSGIAFLDGSVVNVALPAISDDFGTSISGLQWLLNAYMITLSSLLLLGGTLGDRYGRRRVYAAGLIWFTVASILCGLAPTAEFLVAARALQGIGGALLVPGSLSIIAATFRTDDRGRAVGAWSGLAGVASALGPFLGGWLIDSASWRLVFLINVPLAAVAVVLTLRHVPETRAPNPGRLDLVGAALVTAALALISYAAIEHTGSMSMAVGAIGVALFAAFLLVESRVDDPMLPLEIFRSRQFSGANLTTFAVYAGLGGALFLVVVRLQVSLGYSALEAGASLLPFTVLMLTLSPAAGWVGDRIGPRVPMTVGPLVAGVGLFLLGQLGPGDHYVPDVLTGVIVFGLGMAITVAPLTSAVLAGVSEARTGVASGVNNAVARFAGLLAVAALPALAGIATDESLAAGLDAGFTRALRICAALCVSGGVVAAVMVRAGHPVRRTMHPSPSYACQDAGVIRRAA